MEYVVLNRNKNAYCGTNETRNVIYVTWVEYPVPDGFPECPKIFASKSDARRTMRVLGFRPSEFTIIAPILT